MIWVRRAFVIPFALLFFVVLLGNLLLVRFNDTILNESFYVEQLRKADVYNFVLNDLLASALDEARAKDPEDLGSDLDANPLDTTELTTDELVAAVNRVLPPDWVQEQVEQVLEQVGGYATGREDNFSFTIVAKDRVAILVDEAGALFIKANTYDLLFAEVVEPEADKALEDRSSLPFGIPLTSERLVRSARAVVSPEWVEAQVRAVIDELTPYIVGDRDSFRIDVQLSDRADIALEEVKDLLQEGDAHSILYDEVINPKVQESVQGGFGLPYGVTVSEEEILSALQQTTSADWAQEQVDRVVDSSGPYLVGRTDALSVTISLEDNKRDAATVIEDIATVRLVALVEQSPVCGPGEEPLLDQTGLPACIPPGSTAAGLLDQGDIDISGPVQEQVDTLIPNSVTFTEADLRQALIDAGDEHNVELIDDMRELFKDGWVYTVQDLRGDLETEFGDDGPRVLDDLRATLRDGWTYTAADFRQDMIDAGEGERLEELDKGRERIGSVRIFQWVSSLIALAVLTIIGFLGGRRWSSRFAWALGVLTVSSLIILIAAGGVWSVQGSDLIENEREDALRGLDGTKLLVADKLYTIVQNAANEYFSGLQLLALVLLIAGAFLFTLAVLWPTEWGAKIRCRVGLTKTRSPP